LEQTKYRLGLTSRQIGHEKFFNNRIPSLYIYRSFSHSTSHRRPGVLSLRRTILCNANELLLEDNDNELWDKETNGLEVNPLEEKIEGRGRRRVAGGRGRDREKNKGGNVVGGVVGGVGVLMVYVVVEVIDVTS
jgi:hypothetical protein